MLIFLSQISVRRLRITFRNEIRDLLESHNIVEDGNNVSKLYKKTFLTIKPISGYSVLIELGEYKWYATFLIFYFIIYSRVNNCEDCYANAGLSLFVEWEPHCDLSYLFTKTS